MKREEAENRTNRLFVRISIVQTIIAGSTVLISLAALWTAFVQAESTRLQTEASVWPFVDVGYTILPDDEGAQGALFIENTGVGPARIRAVRVLYQGEPMTHWRMYFASTGYERTPYTFIQMTHQVLAPNQSLNALLVRDEDVAAALRRQAMPETVIEFCYCSVFDRCWLATASAEGDPESVDQCPDWSEQRFQN